MKWWEVLKFDEDLYVDAYFARHRNITLDTIDALRMIDNNNKADAIEEIFNLHNIRILWLPSINFERQQLGHVENPRVRPGTEEERAGVRGPQGEPMLPHQRLEIIDERDVVTGIKQRTRNGQFNWEDALMFHIYHVPGNPDDIGNPIGTPYWLNPETPIFNATDGTNTPVEPEQLIQTVVDFIGE